MTASAAELKRLNVLEALGVRDLRLQRLEVVLGEIDRRRLVAGDVEACSRSRSALFNDVDESLHVPRHSARRAFSVPSMGSQRRSMGGRT